MAGQFDNFFGDTPTTPTTTPKAKAPSTGASSGFDNFFDTPAAPAQPVASPALDSAVSNFGDAAIADKHPGLTAFKDKLSSALGLIGGAYHTYNDIKTNVSKELLNIPINAVKGIVEGQIHPSEATKAYEDLTLPKGRNTLEKAIYALPENLIMKPVIRLLHPVFEPYANDLAQSIVAKETAGDVTNGTISYDDYEKMFPVLKKTNLQVIGDSIQAGLGIYFPDLFGGAASKFADSGLSHAVSQGAKTGSVAGGLFGIGQVLSSGSKDPVEIAKIMANNLAGGTLLGVVSHAGIPASKQAIEAATKDIITKYNLPKSMYVPAEKVRDIWQTGKLLTDAEKADVLKVIGSDNTAIKNAIKNGVTIEIPAEKIVQLADKPYWEKIKNSFGFKSEPETISTTKMGDVTQGVRGMLPEGQKPAEMTPVALNDLVAETKAQPVPEMANLAPEATPTPLPFPETIAQEAYKSTISNGGVTIDLGGDKPVEGYAYAPSKGTETMIPSSEFNETHVLDFMKKHENLLNTEGNYLGIWESDGNTYLDVSRVGKPSPETIKEAQANEQLAVFDLKHFKEVPTGQITDGVYNKLHEAIDIHNKHQGEVSGASSEGGSPGQGEVQPSTEPGSPETPGTNEVISTASGRKEAIMKPVGEGETKTSSLYERVKDKLEGEAKAAEVEYNVAERDVQIKKATDFVETYPDRAKRIVQGRELPPEGILKNDIITAYSEQLLSEGKFAEAADALVQQTLQSTRYGQEIQALRGVDDPNSFSSWIKRISSDRLDEISQNLVYEYKKKGKVVTKEKAIKTAVDEGVKEIKQTLSKNQVKISRALDLLNKLTC